MSKPKKLPKARIERVCREIAGHMAVLEAQAVQVAAANDFIEPPGTGVRVDWRRSAPALCDQPGACPPRLERDEMPNRTRAVPWPFRFWKHVKFHDAGCWEWTGYRSASGYGKLGYGPDPLSRKYVSLPAHQVTFILFNGPLPSGTQIDHLCRNRACVNPAHLEAVTPRENVRRRIAPPVHHNTAKTHCKRGHEFTPDNTTWSKDGRRRTCRACNSMRCKAWNRERSGVAA